MKIVPIIIMGVAAILLMGCTAEMYYFGKYSETLYDYKREPSDKTMKNHMAELEDIIKESRDKNIRVPPGIYCEYANLLLQQQRRDDALRYIALEEQTYPESRVFTTRLRNMVLRPTTTPSDSNAIKSEVKPE